jgi:beta-phosphoglucomutase
MFTDIRGVIFDLDGVLVDSAQFHLAAWRRIAAEHGFDFGDDVGELLKGVGRETALGIVLDAGGVEMSATDRAATASRKNRYYNEHLDTLDADALLPGALEALRWLREHHIPVALASASKNARTILDATGIADAFDVVVDGLVVTQAKPNPRVFLIAAEGLGIAPEHCVVFEDAIAGIAGARRAGCAVVGVGDPSLLAAADLVVPTLAAFDWTTLERRRT